MNRITTTLRGAVDQTPCEHCPLRASTTFRPFAPQELDFVRHFKVGELNAAPGTSILLEGAGSAHLYTVLAGWGFRYKQLPDGRRQILNFVLPGDFLGLQSSAFEEMRHSVDALTTMTMCIFSRERLWALYRDHPSLALDLTWIAARQEHLLDENLLTIGRRAATERIAYLLVHLYRRAKEVGLAGDDRMALPFTQQHLADTLGLSLVHTNKSLRRLSDKGVATWRSGELVVADMDALVRMADYDASKERPKPLI